MIKILQMTAYTMKKIVQESKSQQTPLHDINFSERFLTCPLIMTWTYLGYSQ